MKNNKINNLLLIFLGLIIISLNIFIGPSIRNPLLGIYLSSTLLCLLFFVIYLFKGKKIKIVTNKLDLFILLFFISTFIPLIFNKYTSLDSIYSYIQKSISTLSIYILIRNLIDSENKKNILFNILIFASSIILIIGFDRLYTNYFWDILNDFEFFSITYSGDDRFISNFNYPNSLATYLSCILFLLFNQIINTKNSKLKLIYSVYSFILLLAILLTNSRANFIILILFLILFLFSLKDKTNSLKIIKIILISVIGIIIYFLLNNIFIISKWLILFVTILLVTGINYLINKFYKIDKININVKNLIYILLSILLVIIIYLFVALKISASVVIKEPKTYKIQNIENKELYNIKIDFKTFNDNNIIEIIEVNEYAKKTTYIKEKIDVYEGMKEYSFKPSSKMSYFLIHFSNESNKEIRLNKIYIDNKEYIVNYKFLPQKLAYFINTLNLREKSIWQRLDYYKDALNIIKDNWLFGIGADGWKQTFRAHQDYSYVALEVHSFILDIFISFGILGLITLFLIIIYILYLFMKLFKNEARDSVIGIFFALLLLFNHSIIDFDMSFTLIFIFFFILIAFVSNTLDNRKKYNKKSVIIIFLVIISISFIANVLNQYGSIRFNQVKNKHVSLEEKYNEYEIIYKLYPTNIDLRYYRITATKNILYRIKSGDVYDNLRNQYIRELIKFIKDEPYNRQLEMEKLLIEEMIIDIENNFIEKEYLDELYLILKNCILSNKYNYNDIIIRAQYLKTLYKKLLVYIEINEDEYIKKMANNFKNILLNEEEKNLKLFSNYQKSNYNFKTVNNYLNKYKKLINEVK